ncbi:MAG: prephenate dehydratase [Opitutales bacterium]|nr:prephenate dehydratase [Opitutales bacterium]
MKDKFREEIDSIDSEILKLLSRRITCAKEIGKIKLEAGEDIYAPGRETKVFEHLLKKNGGQIDEASLKAIYREIISASISAEKKLQVAYLGPAATFTEQAAIKNFGSSVNYRAMPSIPDIFSSVELAECDYGVVPIENSTDGAVLHTMDMLAESNLTIVGQIYLPIEQCLISRGSLSTIRKICSKDKAIGQCRNWIRRNLPNAQIEYVESTSTAVRLALENAEIAAVASELAAKSYQVPILEAHIQDMKNNITRFLVVGKKPSPKADGVQYKTSVVISLNDRPGALCDMILPFGRYGINLTRIESRPSHKKLWDYLFFIDFLGHIDDENVQMVFKRLKEEVPLVKWLGSYPVE